MEKDYLKHVSDSVIIETSVLSDQSIVYNVSIYDERHKLVIECIDEKQAFLFLDEIELILKTANGFHIK